MKDEKENIHELSILYFEGRITGSNEKLLFNYIQQSFDNRAQFKLWEKEWLDSGNADASTVHEWERLQCKVRTQEAIIPMLITSKVNNWKRIAAVAAIIIIAIGIRQIVSLLQPETYFAFEAPYGEKGKMILSDGTIVWLNAGSTLKYSENFNSTNRRVILNGEAYFEVTKKRGATFVVHTYGYNIVVKGTKFNVSAYPDDSFITTTLLEGNVDILYDKQKISMLPGESVKLDIASNQFISSRVNAIQSRAWSENRIEYDDITLQELVVKLSRQYDVKIHLKSNKITDKRFRISLRNRETIEEVITALKDIIPITVERKDKDIYIKE